MAGLEDLYRQIILDHYRNPRNRGTLPEPARKVDGFNPLCGDEIVLYVSIADGVIDDLKIDGHGCSISQASASMMTSMLKGQTVEQARALTRRFKSMMSIEEDSPSGAGADEELKLGDLESLSGVKKYPVRIKCATLAWNTLIQGLEGQETVDASQIEP